MNSFTVVFIEQICFQFLVRYVPESFLLTKVNKEEFDGPANSAHLRAITEVKQN
jgi:hypothetical protein